MKTYGRKRIKAGGRRDEPLLLTPASSRLVSHFTPSSSSTSTTATPSTAGATSPTQRDQPHHTEHPSPSTRSTPTSLSFTTPANMANIDSERVRRHSLLKAVPMCSLKSASSSPQPEATRQCRGRDKGGGSQVDKSGNINGSTLTTSPLAVRSNPWSRVMGGGIPTTASKRWNSGQGVRQPTLLSTGSKRKRSRASASLPTGRTAKGEQTFLDFGQRSFGRRVLCQRCDMLYVCGAGEDEARHAITCARAARGVEFAGWKQERVKTIFPDDGGRVVEIRQGDPGPHLAKLQEVERLMDADMGFAAGARDDGGLLRSEKGGKRAGGSAKLSYAFVYVRDKRVLGCVIAERIDTARRVMPWSLEGDSGLESNSSERDFASEAAGKGASVVTDEMGALGHRSPETDVEDADSSWGARAVAAAAARADAAAPRSPFAGSCSLIPGSGSKVPDQVTSRATTQVPGDQHQLGESSHPNALAMEPIEDTDYIIDERREEDVVDVSITYSSPRRRGEIQEFRDDSREGCREPLLPYDGFSNSDVRSWSAGKEAVSTSKMKLPRTRTETPPPVKRGRLDSPENGRLTPPLASASSTSSPPPLSGERPRLGIRRSVVLGSEIDPGISPNESVSTPSRARSSTPSSQHERPARPANESPDEAEASSAVQCRARHAVAGVSSPMEKAAAAGLHERRRSFSIDSTSSSIVSSPHEEVPPPLPRSGLVCAQEETPAVVGILQIWVHASSRRQGVATRLVDTVREKMVYGCPLRPNQIAFSQPTREGLAFATRYTDCNLLVY